jgi:cbb3-type cytochrome oxidase subunit 3
MSLTDIMSAANLDGYAQVALILFILAFVLIAWRVLSRRNDDTYEKAKRMPLDDEHPQTPRTPPNGH